MDYNDNKIKEESFLQIDVKNIGSKTVVCNLYTGLLCPEIYMKREDYEYLLAKGFFKRASLEHETDGADIYATSQVYRIPNLITTG